MALPDSDNEFLTVADVAGLLKLNQQTVRNWIDQGSLPAVRVGRRVRIRRVDLDRLIAQGSQGTTLPLPVTAEPNAHDFWGGEPVGAPVADPAPVAGTAQSAGSSPTPQTTSIAGGEGDR